MPVFHQLPIGEVIPDAATWRTAETVKEYLKYINELRPGHVGRLGPTAGETVHAVRRRLGMAARSVGEDLVIKQADGLVYFWVPDRDRVRAKRRRPR